MRLTFTFPGRFSGTNDIIRKAAWNRFVGGKLRKQEKMACAWHIRAQKRSGVPNFASAVKVSFAWIEPNAKRDLDNITGGQKVILDALVMEGILQNDTRQWIKGISHSFPDPDKLNPRIEVQIEEV